MSLLLVPLVIAVVFALPLAMARLEPGARREAGQRQHPTATARRRPTR